MPWYLVKRLEKKLSKVYVLGSFFLTIFDQVLK